MNYLSNKCDQLKLRAIVMCHHFLPNTAILIGENSMAILPSVVLCVV